MPKVSIIIPIYKAEKYIERCVKSLMEQTMEEIEYIFINDCTPDNSMNILEKTISKYPNRKNQIVTINNRINLGPSESRKNAINIATGNYIGFCDSDDWVDSNMYEIMYDATNKEEIDIIVSNYFYETETSKTTKTLTPSNTPQESLAHLDDSYKFSYAMWNQLIRKEYIKEQISQIYPTKIREDTYLMMRIYYHAKSIKFLPMPLYHWWRSNTESLTHNVGKSMQDWEEQRINFSQICELLYSNKGYNKYHLACNKFKYMLKLEYKTAFKDLKSFYYAFKESHVDIDYIFKEECDSLAKRLKYKIIYNTHYFIYKLYFVFKNV